jgi:hypothetical protein
MPEAFCLAGVLSDFWRLASAVEHRDFFDIIRRCTGRCIFGSVPQCFGRGVESIHSLICCTARVVRSGWNLFTCFRCGWFWHRCPFLQSRNVCS